MSKSLLERYEQILSQDPTSSVFVELAKALLEKGDPQRAIDTCQQGLVHHPTSVVGRVLWGKALINLGRPAEAMEQFDRAVALDKDNPHAYNLIGEVLLRKGLFRSALPLLRRAVALQPDDGRVRQWLEQTQRALAGGPAPVLSESTLIDTVQDLNPAGDAQALPTEVHQAYIPQVRVSRLDAQRPTHDALPALKLPPVLTEAPPELAVHVQPTPEALGAVPSASPADAGPSAAPGPDDAFSALVTPKPPPPAPDLSGEFSEFPSDPPMPVGPLPTPKPLKLISSPGALPAIVRFDAPPARPPAEAEGEPERDAAPESELRAEAPAPPPPEPAKPVPPPVRRTHSHPLLSELPELPVAASAVELPKVELSAQAAAAIATEYERELREKLAKKEEEKRKSFLGRHWMKIAISAVLGAGLVVGGWAYLHTRAKFRNQNLATTLAAAKKAAMLDTAAGYKLSLKALEDALEMDAHSSEAWALKAYAEAMLYAEHTHQSEERQAANAALQEKGVETQFPSLALVSHYQLSKGKEREGLSRAVLASTLPQPEIQELAGRILLEKKDSVKAVKRLQAALATPTSLVTLRAQVALADYYRDFGDDGHALQFYRSAEALSPTHPEVLLGEAESRLSLGQELDQALAEVRKVPDDTSSPQEIRARRALDEGKLLAATGDPRAGLKALAAGAARFPNALFDFQLALGDVAQLAGDMAQAQRALEVAVKLHPRSDPAKEALARVLLARGNERELLSRLPADGNDRKLLLLRGEAYAKLRDWRRARTELARTQVSGRYPPEAVVYLALADAAEGEPEKAQAVLEKVKGSVKQPQARGALLTALGAILWQKGDVDGARRQFAEAAEDPRDFEGNCSLGRLLLFTGSPDKAIPSLQQALARNGSHGEAREALTRALLSVGKTQDALAQVDAWQKDDPADARADKLLGLVKLRQGEVKQADAASNRAARKLPRDAEAQRIRAEVLFARGQSRAGAATLKRAQKLDGADVLTGCALGRALLRMEKSEDADKLFSSVQKRSPSAACAPIGIASAAPRQASVRALAELARRAPDVWDRAQALATLGRVQALSGNLRDAKRSADEAVHLAPGLADGYWAQGLVAEKGRDLDVAKDALEKALALDPDDARIRLTHAEALSRSDEDLGKAVSEYQAFLRLVAKSPEQARVKKLLPALKKRASAR